MKRRKELEDPNSCLNRAHDDEPIFVLRAHDPIAPQIVLAWAIEYACYKRERGEFTDVQGAKYDDAVQLSVEMRAWQKKHPAVNR